MPITGAALAALAKGDMENFIVATTPDHSMWSDIVDADGKKVAGMFFKAAFYDMNCHVSFNN